MVLQFDVTALKIYKQSAKEGRYMYSWTDTIIHLSKSFGILQLLIILPVYTTGNFFETEKKFTAATHKFTAI
jgi:hypothetical protein